MFESYLQGHRGTLRSRAPALTLSVVLHGGGVALLLFLSLFHVEELPEPQVTVTFFSAPPPPPPPPPPAPAAQVRPRRRVVRAAPKPKPSEIQPPEMIPPSRPQPPLEPEPASGNGVEGGVEGGVPGGVPGGVLAPRSPTEPEPEPEKARPVFVRSQVVESLKLSGELPVLVPAAREARLEGVVIIKVCLKATGEVDPALTKILKSLPLQDEEVLSKIRTWRYRPYRVNGVPQAVCFPVRFVFKFR